MNLSIIIASASLATSVTTLVVVVVALRHVQSESVIVRKKVGRIKRKFQQILDTIDV